ncbi:hypothetical protein H0A61_01696 [Koleobacter methoxysyntrophicus]|jgi:hypothetical protein|uniref:Uncharacterized protein n=1 Tax=Koleobacter methoxysyntrophicus TaxID=2751313 RepID=A0A8A0RLQ2_9FIRM|nr:hypothetical protein [Koleobacter methoxysyntrophicus]QSQ09335.1 hypothetical protein H0A61_01696 [Koleobacter methoxysyntrophicus]
MHLTFGIFLDIAIIMALGLFVAGVFIIVKNVINFFSKKIIFVRFYNKSSKEEPELLNR